MLHEYGDEDNAFLTLDLSRTSALLIEMVSTPLPHQPPRQLKPNNPLAHTQHLRIIAQNTPLHREAIMRSHSPDARDLVRRDRDSKPSAADQDRAVGIALGDHLRGFDGGVCVRGLVASGQDADVEHFGYARVFLKVCFEGGAVAQAGVVAAEDDGHGFCGAHGRGALSL